MKHEAAVLKRELDRIGVRRGRCVAPELRERITEWLVRERSGGRSISDLATELGIASGTVIRWSSGGKRRTLVPVVVAADPVSPRTVRVVSPNGFFIDGLKLAEATALLRELG